MIRSARWLAVDLIDRIIRCAVSVLKAIFAAIAGHCDAALCTACGGLIKLQLRINILVRHAFFKSTELIKRLNDK